jgi:hypothetical protein
MPLAFESLSHGTVAFGFFNIESDMLLLDHYFLFADRFCSYINILSKNAATACYRTQWMIYHIDSQQDIGDLMGAIHGIRYTGFIGELYRRFPFPRQQEMFRQKPGGYQTQPIVMEIIAKYAQPREISIAISAKGDEIQIGDYRFNRNQFHELIKYVWRGGYPRWKDEIRPDYVSAMKDSLRQNCTGILKKLDFEDLS